MRNLARRLGQRARQGIIAAASAGQGIAGAAFVVVGVVMLFGPGVGWVTAGGFLLLAAALRSR